MILHVCEYEQWHNIWCQVLNAKSPIGSNTKRESRLSPNRITPFSRVIACKQHLFHMLLPCHLYGTLVPIIDCPNIFLLATNCRPATRFLTLNLYHTVTLLKFRCWVTPFGVLIAPGIKQQQCWRILTCLMRSMGHQ